MSMAFAGICINIAEMGDFMEILHKTENAKLCTKRKKRKKEKPL